MAQRHTIEGIDVDYALIFTHAMITMRDGLQEAENSGMTKEDQLDKIVKPIISSMKNKLRQARAEQPYDLEEWGI